MKIVYSGIKHVYLLTASWIQNLFKYKYVYNGMFIEKFEEEAL